ncbi:MAG: cytochrome c [Bacteroidota bacterium]
MKWIKASLPFLLLLLLAMACQSDNPYKQGEILYLNFCSNCHMDNGAGLGELIPPVAQSDYLANHQSNIACLIKYGMEGEIVVNGKTYNQPMPAVPQLNDVEITNVINYLNHAWGNDLGTVRLQDVQQQLEQCVK